MKIVVSKIKWGKKECRFSWEINGKNSLARTREAAEERIRKDNPDAEIEMVDETESKEPVKKDTAKAKPVKKETPKPVKKEPKKGIVFYVREAIMAGEDLHEIAKRVSAQFNHPEKSVYSTCQCQRRYMYIDGLIEKPTREPKKPKKKYTSENDPLAKIGM